ALESAQRIRDAIAALDLRQAELRELHELANEMRVLLDRLVELIDRPTDFNRVVSRVDEVRLRISRLDRTYHLLSAVSQFGELRRYNADRALGDHEIETRASAAKRLKRDREFVREFIDGCEFLLEMLPQTTVRLRAADREPQDVTGQSKS